MKNIWVSIIMGTLIIITIIVMTTGIEPEQYSLPQDASIHTFFENIEKLGLGDKQDSYLTPITENIKIIPCVEVSVKRGNGTIEPSSKSCN